ncbi:MAG: hypothetical protein KGR24_10465 [Planctomycetes bacterium]|nr:hypothetical protein [Planctomycetota bacterium]
MSETSEKMGRCFSEVYERRGSPSELKIADAIDRLAADVAAIKGAACDRNGWPVGWLIEVDRLIRLRDEAQAEVEKLRQAVGLATTAVGDMVIDVENPIGMMQRVVAEVEKMRMQLAACGVLADCNTTDSLERNRRMHPDYDCASVQSVIRAVEREIGLRAEVERLKAELAARPADGNRQATLDSSPAAPPPAVWLTEEERRILSAHVQALRDQRRAMERGGQTLGYSANPCGLKREADAIDALLSRAGSPPVVEVPAMIGGGWLRTTHLRYRAALDKAGIPWKEVGRE